MAAIQSNDLDLSQLIFRKAFVDTLPGFQCLVGTLGRWPVDGDNHSLMLGEFKGFLRSQNAMLIDCW
jgi:hypothetical protein